MQFTSLEVHKKRRKCCEPNCMFTPGATKAINLLKKKKKHSYDVTMAMSLVELFLTFFFFFLVMLVTHAMLLLSLRSLLLLWSVGSGLLALILQL